MTPEQIAVLQKFNENMEFIREPKKATKKEQSIKEWSRIQIDKMKTKEAIKMMRSDL